MGWGNDQVAELPDNEPAAVEPPPQPVRFGVRDAPAPEPVAPVPAVDPAKDTAALADLAKFKVETSTGEATSREVMQYKMLHPEMSYDSIKQNLDTLRIQARSANTDWKAIADQHPVLMDYIKRDPETMHLALGQSASLQAIQTNLGGNAAYGSQPDAAKIDGYTGEHSFSLTAGLVGFGEQMWHGFYYGSNEALYGFGKAFATGFALADDAIGKVVGIKNGGDWWRGLASYYGKEAEAYGSKSHIDVHGDSLKNSSKIVKTLAGVADATATFLPYALEAGAATIGSGGMATPFLFNTIMQAGQVFRAAEAKGATEGQAVVQTVLGAPLMGAAMSASPLSRASDLFASKMTKDALAKLMANESPSLARMAWTTAARGGIDAASGQVALGLQSATAQLAASANVKDLKEVPTAFWQGVSDPSLLGFHAISVLGTVGRIHRSAVAVQEFDNLIKGFEAANPDAAEATMRADAARRVAEQKQAHPGVYYPLQEFLAEADRLGKDPRELAVSLFNDGGAAYDVTLATRGEHLLVPPERIEHMIKSDLGESFKQNGTLDQTLDSRRFLHEQIADLEKVFDGEYRAAAKLDPDKLSPKDEPLYRAAQALTKLVTMEGVDVPHIIAEVRTMASRRPDMTHAEIFNALYGPQGVYAKESRGSLTSMSPETVQVESKRVAAEGGEEPSAIYTHKDSPLRVTVKPDALDTQYVSPILDTQGGGAAENLGAAEFKGLATAMYVRALSDAKVQGKGFRSDTDRFNKTDDMYRRLIKAGVPFKLVENVDGSDRWTLSPKDLSKLDLKQTWENITSGKRNTPSPVRLIEMAGHLTGYEDPRWFNVFKDDQAVRDAKEASAKADAAAFKEILDALVSNDKRFMEGARDEALTEAKRQLDADPVVRVARLARGDWEGATPEQMRELRGREGGLPYRFHADEVEAMIGPVQAKALAEKYPNLIAKSSKVSIDVEAAAQILGYKSDEGQLASRKLLGDLLKAPDEKQAAEALAQAHLDQKYGPDLLSNPSALMAAALDATHTPEATGKLLGLYRKLSSDLDPATRARGLMTSDLWHEHAERLLSSKLLEEIDPHFFAEVEGRAMKRALDILDGKGEDRSARAAGAKHVEQAILYHHLYLAAREATNTLGAAKRRLARSAGSDLPVQRLGFADPTAGEDGMNAYQRAREGALAAVGLAKARPGTDYKGAVQALVDRATEIGQHGYLSNGFNWHPEVVQKIIDGQSGWGKLTPDEARQLHSFVTNVENLGSKLGTRTVANDPHAASEGIESFLSARPELRKLYLDKNLGTKDANSGVKGALREIVRLPTNFAKMLGWNDSPANWQVSLLLQHLGPEGDKLNAMLQQAIIDRHELMDKLYKPWREIHDRTMANPKVFQVAEGADKMLNIGDWGQAKDRRVTYAWLMNLARWYGDGDGRARILKQFKLIPDNVEKTLATYLTKDDLANIQAEKDLIEREWYPRLAQKQLERTGEPLRRSQPAPFEINGVKYKGGHVTLSYDDRAGMGVDPRRQLSDSTLGSFKHDAITFHRATMESSFLQERSGPAVGQHPDLSSLTTPQTMADMAHHLAVGDFLLHANEALLNPSTAGVIESHLGEGAVKAVSGWLKRTATEMRGGPEQIDSGSVESTRAMRDVRNTLIMAAVAGKVTIPLAHATHPFMAGIMQHGWGYAAKYTLPAFTEMMNSLPNWLATGQNEYIEKFQAESAYLRQRRAETPNDIAEMYFDREMQMSGAPKNAIMKMKDGVETYGSLPLRLMDDIFSATIYHARKMHALAENGGDEIAAIKSAEQDVFKAMPNFALHARSGFASTKSGFQSVITPFMGYYATVRDLYRSGMFDKIEKAVAEREARTGEAAPLWYRRAKGVEWQAKLAVPVILGLSLGAFLKGAGPKQEEDLPEYMTLNAGYWQREWGTATGTAAFDAGKESIIAMSELYPLAPTFVEGSLKMAGAVVHNEKIGKMRGQTNILFSPFDSLGRAGEQTFSPRYGPGDAALSWAKGLAPALGIPTAPVSNVGGMAVNYEEFLDQLPKSKLAQSIDIADRMVYPHSYGRSAKYQPLTPLRMLRDAIEEANNKPKVGRVTPF